MTRDSGVTGPGPGTFSDSVSVSLGPGPGPPAASPAAGPIQVQGRLWAGVVPRDLTDHELVTRDNRPALPRASGSGGPPSAPPAPLPPGAAHWQALTSEGPSSAQGASESYHVCRWQSVTASASETVTRTVYFSRNGLRALPIKTAAAAAAPGSSSSRRH